MTEGQRSIVGPRADHIMDATADVLFEGGADELNALLGIVAVPDDPPPSVGDETLSESKQDPQSDIACDEGDEDDGTDHVGIVPAMGSLAKVVVTAHNVLVGVKYVDTHAGRSVGACPTM